MFKITFTSIVDFFFETEEEVLEIELEIEDDEINYDLIKRLFN